MTSAAVSTRKSRPRSTKVLRLFILPTIASSFAVVEAYSNFHHGHTRKFGSINPRTISNDAPSPFTFGHHRKNLNQYLQHREHICASTTACKSANTDDAATSTYAPTTHLSTADIEHMKLATSLARIGYGNTFPNPAVGCVLVRHDDDEADAIIGSGFHPKAGMPHAEVFALLEACGHLEDGVAAARSVMGVLADSDTSSDDETLENKVLDLLTTYKSEDGASKLFNNHFDDCDVTAYVTLEPCCHVGQTPPCALSLVAAGINRVVVGYRDPNPRVDGGGIQLLENAGIDVHVLSQSPSSNEVEAATECSNLVKYFVKRISPREDPVENLNDSINGKKRRVLRTIGGRQKSAGTIQPIAWPKGDYIITDDDKKSGDFAENVPLANRFLERIDQSLWDHEIVLLRLNNVVQKKKGAKILGGRIAESLDAHVAQVIGHTVLLYRPAFPPVLDLDELIKIDADDSNSD
mmetsp:Transcript_24038/g.43129  ORF Transcript_24038/g.43129 Transcript_24038/m.43129 type:complete len:465 (+) Transcript_24038:304-1698(+)